MATFRILVVRLGAMGDVLHALPAVASLKQSFPHCHLTWAIEQKWAELLAGNPFVDQVLTVDRKSLSSLLDLRRRLRADRFDFAVDFQGLLKSALIAASARPNKIYGFSRSQVRERLAALFYSHTCKPRSEHVVDRNLELAQAAGATNVVRVFHIPPGQPEGELPTAILCWRIRWRVGKARNGRWRITRCWQRGCRTSSRFRWF
jgi:ADP-heptose:LPS heptosyltransferase